MTNKVVGVTGEHAGTFSIETYVVVRRAYVELLMVFARPRPVVGRNAERKRN